MPKVSPMSSLWGAKGPLIMTAINDACRMEKVTFPIILSFTHNTADPVSPYFLPRPEAVREREREREIKTRPDVTAQWTHLL